MYGVRNLLESESRETNNETVLLAILKIANNTVNKLAVDNANILFTPNSATELEENTNMLNSIISLKIKNTLINK
jgi:hypothetical protein